MVKEKRKKPFKKSYLLLVLAIGVIGLLAGIGIESADWDFIPQLVPVILYCLLPIFGLASLLTLLSPGSNINKFRRSSSSAYATVIDRYRQKNDNSNTDSEEAEVEVLGKLILAITNTPAGNYHIVVEFPHEEKNYVLDAQISTDLYSRLEIGSKVKIRYAQGDPTIALIGDEIDDFGGSNLE